MRAQVVVSACFGAAPCKFQLWDLQRARAMATLLGSRPRELVDRGRRCFLGCALQNNSPFFLQLLKLVFMHGGGECVQAMDVVVPPYERS